MLSTADCMLAPNFSTMIPRMWIVVSEILKFWSDSSPAQNSISAGRCGTAGPTFVSPVTRRCSSSIPAARTFQLPVSRSWLSTLIGMKPNCSSVSAAGVIMKFEPEFFMMFFWCSANSCCTTARSKSPPKCRKPQQSSKRKRFGWANTCAIKQELLQEAQDAIDGVVEVEQPLGPKAAADKAQTSAPTSSTSSTEGSDEEASDDGSRLIRKL